MTVFMGTRQRYQLGRFQYHSKFAWSVVISLLLVPVIGLGGNPQVPILWCTTTAAALTTKNGRRVAARLSKEAFYGSLFTFTGTYYTNGANRVGN